MKISKKFKKMSVMYKFFARHWEHVLDFSDEVLKAMYVYENTGVDNVQENNGYKYLNLNVTMWKDEITINTLYDNYEFKECH